MDGLRRQAREDFLREQQFSSQPAQKLELLEARLSASGRSSVKRESVPALSILQRLASPAKADTGLLHLVRIDFHHQPVLNVDKAIFLALFDEFRLEPYTLVLLLHETYGFHHFRAPPAAGAAGGSAPSSDGISTFYVKNREALIVWSHDPALNWTRGIMIERQRINRQPSRCIFEYFAKAIEQQCHHFVGQAWLLRLVVLVDMAAWIDSRVNMELMTLRWAETRTGHGGWVVVRFGEDLATDEVRFEGLAEVSQRLGFVATSLANLARHIELAEQLSTIPALTALCPPDARDEIPTAAGSGVDKLLDAAAVLRLLTVKFATRKKDVYYLQQRTQHQLSVVFNLITQNDARSSQEIAAAAKADSASMRFLAVVATFFLPATFFATLFSVPTLHWSENEVMSSRFWIYWAFTLPCTVVLFIVYLGWSSAGLDWLKGLPRKIADRAKARNGKMTSKRGRVPDVEEAKAPAAPAAVSTTPVLLSDPVEGKPVKGEEMTLQSGIYGAPWQLPTGMYELEQAPFHVNPGQPQMVVTELR